MNYIDEIIAEICSIYGVEPPKYVLNCERICPSVGNCNSLACYLPSMRTIFFKGSKPHPRVVAHEVGHHVHVVKGNIVKFFTYQQLLQSEKFANQVEEWAEQIWENRKFFNELTKHVIIVAGTALVVLAFILIDKDTFMRWMRKLGL